MTNINTISDIDHEISSIAVSDYNLFTDALNDCRMDTKVLDAVSVLLNFHDIYDHRRDYGERLIGTRVCQDMIIHIENTYVYDRKLDVSESRYFMYAVDYIIENCLPKNILKEDHDNGTWRENRNSKEATLKLMIVLEMMCDGGEDMLRDIIPVYRGYISNYLVLFNVNSVSNYSNKDYLLCYRTWVLLRSLVFRVEEDRIEKYINLGCICGDNNDVHRPFMYRLLEYAFSVVIMFGIWGRVFKEKSVEEYDMERYRMYRDRYTFVMMLAGKNFFDDVNNETYVYGLFGSLLMVDIKTFTEKKVHILCSRIEDIANIREMGNVMLIEEKFDNKLCVVERQEDLIVCYKLRRRQHKVMNVEDIFYDTEVLMSYLNGSGVYVDDENGKVIYKGLHTEPLLWIMFIAIIAIISSAIWYEYKSRRTVKSVKDEELWKKQRKV